MSLKGNERWPVLTRYDLDHLRRVALPLGGIGTGTVSLGGRGDLRDWEIVNRPAKGFSPRHAFFALFARASGGEAVTRVLEGPIDPADFAGPFGSPVPNHGLPRFRSCTFLAAYPFGQVLLSDPEVPLEVRVEAFNPLVPGDADTSGIPAAILRYTLQNTSDVPVAASVCGSLQNFIGTDGTEGVPLGNANRFRADDAAGVRGLYMRTTGVPEAAEQWGTLALVAVGAGDVSYRTAWAAFRWGDALLDFWEDFRADGRVDDRAGTGERFGRPTTGEESADAPVGSLSVGVEVPPHGSIVVTFLLCWHFPNRQTWTPSSRPAHRGDGEHGESAGDGLPDTIGNYYTTRQPDAWAVAVATAKSLPHLEEATLSFVRSFCASDLPAAVKEAALFNLSTLRTQTCFRTPDGRFYGWEGCGDRKGSCHGSCTHVWNYEQATAFLFGDLACSMRETEFLHATDAGGRMSFRTALPPGRASDGVAAADGQMGCLMKLYRDWQLSGDEDLLRRLWPAARKALEFCWLPGGWDADRDGVMEGCQHNTYDIEFYGPNPLSGIWYLGALRAAEEMAAYLGELPFARTCRDLFERGRSWIDRNLFNGDFYEQQVRPPGDEASIAPGLRLGAGAFDLGAPELQLGAGCLIDQLAGQFVARVCGLGDLVDPDHIRATARSIMVNNFRETLFGHANHMRSFALNDEAGLLICTYPRGGRPARPFPYFTEIMSGFEYAAAALMIYEGQVDEGVRCVEAIRKRHDGRRRNPFNEAECGHHYARAMASWATVLALTGFHYSAITREIQFAGASTPTQTFWSSGHAWGTCRQVPTGSGAEIALTVLHGRLAVARVRIAGVGGSVLAEPRVLASGQTAHLAVQRLPR